MTNLRKIARGQSCQIRLPGVCNGNPETTVLCHYRLSGISGIGKKSPDWMGAWGCSDCHRVVDGQTRSQFEREELKLYLAEGVFRTLDQLYRMGAL